MHTHTVRDHCPSGIEILNIPMDPSRKLWHWKQTVYTQKRRPRNEPDHRQSALMHSPHWDPIWDSVAVLKHFLIIDPHYAFRSCTTYIEVHGLVLGISHTVRIKHSQLFSQLRLILCIELAEILWVGELLSAVHCIGTCTRSQSTSFTLSGTVRNRLRPDSLGITT